MVAGAGVAGYRRSDVEPALFDQPGKQLQAVAGKGSGVKPGGDRPAFQIGDDGVAGGAVAVQDGADGFRGAVCCAGKSGASDSRC